jgi:hypothetical protein
MWSLFGSAEARAVEQLLLRASVAMGEPAARRPGAGEFVAARMALDVDGASRALNLQQVEAAIERYVARGPHLHQIQDLDLVVEPPDARATGLLGISESQVGDLHADERPFEVWLTRDEDWRITRLALQPAHKNLPEARP